MGKGENKPDYEEMSWLIFKEQFQNENDCYKWLFITRWHNGFIYPK